MWSKLGLIDGAALKSWTFIIIVLVFLAVLRGIYKNHGIIWPDGVGAVVVVLVV